MEHLARVIAGDYIPLWLNKPIVGVDNQKPRELLADGEYRRVASLISELEAPTFTCAAGDWCSMSARWWYAAPEWATLQSILKGAAKARQADAADAATGVVKADFENWRGIVDVFLTVA